MTKTALILRRRRMRDRFTLTFFAPMAVPRLRMGTRAVATVEKPFTRQGIESRYGKKVTSFDERGVALADGSRIDPDLREAGRPDRPSYLGHLNIISLMDTVRLKPDATCDSQQRESSASLPPRRETSGSRPWAGSCRSASPHDRRRRGGAPPVCSRRDSGPTGRCYGRRPPPPARSRH
jgi:hypothetical protein